MIVEFSMSLAGILNVGGGVTGYRTKFLQLITAICAAYKCGTCFGCEICRICGLYDELLIPFLCIFQCGF